MARERYAASDRNFTLSTSDFDRANALLKKRNEEYPHPTQTPGVCAERARQSTHLHDTSASGSQAPHFYPSNVRRRLQPDSRDSQFSNGRMYSDHRSNRRDRSRSRSRSRHRNEYRRQYSGSPYKSRHMTRNSATPTSKVDTSIAATNISTIESPKFPLKAKEPKGSKESAKKKKDKIVKSKSPPVSAPGEKNEKKLSCSPKVKRKRTGLSSKSVSGPLLDTELEAARKKLGIAKQQLCKLKQNVSDLEQQMRAKSYEIQDIELVMKGLQDRQQLQQQFLKSRNSLESASDLRTDSFVRALTPNGFFYAQEVRSAPPAIIRDPEPPRDPETPARKKPLPLIKKKEEAKRATTKADRNFVKEKVEIDEKIKIRNGQSVSSSSTRDVMDHFWSTNKSPDLLTHTAVASIPDGCSRKLRTLEFNPVKPDIFATSSDDGSVILWNYQASIQRIDRLVSFASASFRDDLPAAESMAWSRDGDRLAVAFRDPLPNGHGEFCVVRLHQLAIPDDPTEQLVIPSDRIIHYRSKSQIRGISAIAWVPSGRGNHETRGIITACPNHTVCMWDQVNPSSTSLKDDTSSWKDTLLHDGHRSEIRSLCVHSQGQAVYTGGSDGLVIRYDFHTGTFFSIVNRRQSCSIGKINCVLEHPLNPHLLLISSVEPSAQSLMLHDTRVRYADRQQAASMTLRVMKDLDTKALSKYVVPRWAADGFHVSCGSASGKVHIWDLRAQTNRPDSGFPDQSIQVHRKRI